jgi:hypothetical protein
MNYLKRISELRLEIEKINLRIETNNQSVGQIRPESIDLETQLRILKKTNLLDPNDFNKKAISEIEKKLIKSRNIFDDLSLLEEALKEKREEFVLELEETEMALKSDECKKMISKEQGIVEFYEQAVRDAHKAIVEAKVLADEVRKRGGVSRFNGINYSNFDFYLLEINAGSYVKLLDRDVNKEAIIKNLLS